MRDARDRLTSTSGTRPVFDYELMRLFAQNRLSASLVVLLLVGTVGFLSSLWTGAVTAGIWTAGVLLIHVVMISKCRQFLADAAIRGEHQAWRIRFVMLDLFFGLAWMFNLVQPVGVTEGTGTFMLFVMLLVVAVSSMLASSLPIAVFAATVPVTGAVAINFALKGNLHDYILAHHGGDGAGLFPAARAPALFVGAADAAGARREGHADRRTGSRRRRSPTKRATAPKPPTSRSRASSRR